MAMDNHVEDVYLKGMMAFSAKDYQKAYGYWQNVLEMEPGHEEANKGIKKLNNLRKKRTPKEILGEIKKYYSSQEYEKALKLCNMLVSRFPDNQDLVGLKKKIVSRIERASKVEATPAPPPVANLDSTMYFQQKAEETDWESEQSNSDDGSEDDQSERVEQLIQQGVTLYEIQDYEQAQVVWNKALELDPGNKKVLNYLEDVESLLEKSDSEEKAAISPTGEAPGKEELITIYNEGKDLYKQKKFHEALEKWRFILDFFPNHKETLLCVERAESAIQEDDEHLKNLELAEQAYSDGDYTEAERLVLPIIIKAPHLTGAQKLKDAIEERKKQINEIKNLELEGQLVEQTAIASDDEITKYFTPTEDNTSFSGGSDAPKMVISASDIRKSDRTDYKKMAVLMGIVAVAAVIIGGFFIWKNRTELSNRIIADAPVQVTIPRVIRWYSNEARVNDYMEIAAESGSLGDYFMAYCAYDKALQLSDAAMTEMVDQKDSLEALDNIRKAKQAASTDKEQARKKIVPEEYDKDEFEKLLRGWEPENAMQAIPVLRAALTNDVDDYELREYLSKAESQKALATVNDLSALEYSLNSFKRAAVLGPKGNRNRGHFKVIQLFYTNAIDDHEREQWFFLFTGK